MAGPRARNATAYVTLEPCNHSGRTPPCSEKLLAAGISRVIYATDDVNTEVAGHGSALLRDNGISVSSGLMRAQARLLNRGFFMRHEQGRPFVTVKVAMTLDAKIGLKSGESKWITGPEARTDVQRLRAQSCAIVTGKGTVRSDDPRLSVRDESLQTLGRQPLAVVLDSSLSLGTDYRIFDKSANCIIMHCVESTNANYNVRVQKVSQDAGKIDLKDALSHLAKLECNEVLVEAGPTLSSAFIVAGLWDELVVYMAPKLIGESGRDGFALPEVSELSEAKDVKLSEVRYVGRDIRLTFTRG